MHDPQQRHLRGRQRIGRGADFFMPLEQQLPEAMQLPGRKRLHPPFDRGAVFGRGGLWRGFGQLGKRDPVRQLYDAAQDRQRLDA